MALTRQQALDTLALWKPAPIFLQVYEVPRLPEQLDIYFGPPEEFFLDPSVQQDYTFGRLVPILDDGNFGLITLSDPQAQSLLQVDLETPEATRAVFVTWQQYLGDLMIRIGESVDDDERLRRISDLVEFTALDELFAFFELSSELRGTNYEILKKRFLEDLSE